MLKKLSLVVCIFIFLIILILAFENLFAMKASYFLLFWKMSGSVTWVIMISFFLGLIFGMALFTFLSQGDVLIGDNNESPDSESEWG